MKYFILPVIFLLLGVLEGRGQSMYGDAVKADVKVKYLDSYEEALTVSAREHKPVFFNCFADWALPCHGMDQWVFSDAEFARWLNEHFVCLCLDMSRPEQKKLVEKYRVRFFACFLILDSRGEELHRIVGGSRLSEFKEQVARGLDPDRCLAGLTRKYDAGDRTPDFMRDYIYVLRTADRKDRLEEVIQEYVARLDPQEFPKKENWSIFTSLLQDANSEHFPFLLENYDVFVKENGKEVVDPFVSVMYIRVIYPYLFDDKGYEQLNADKLRKEIGRFLPETDVVFTYLKLAEARGEKRYQDFIGLLKNEGHKIQPEILQGADVSLAVLVNDYMELRPVIENYLNGRMKEVPASVAETYKEALVQVDNAGKGVRFEECTFDEILALSEETGKPVFMDCYTSWCGPCKMLSKKVFPLKFVGDFFNDHFVSIKMDMEKGEGKELAERYGVKVYPTLLVLDSSGNLIHRFTGGRSPQSLLEEVRRALADSTAYGPVKARFDAGDRSPEVVTEYLNNAVAASEMDENTKMKEAEEYFDSLPENERLSGEMLGFYKNFATDPENSMAAYFLKHWKDYRRDAGVEQVDRCLLDIYFPVLMNTLPTPDLKDKKIVGLLKDIESAGCVKEKSALGYLVSIVKWAGKEDWSKILKLYKQEISQMEYRFAQMNLDMLWKRFWTVVPQDMKGEIKNYLENEQRKTTSTFVKNYTTLLEVLK